MQPLVSIIIPVYNVSKYLKKCLDSVIHQTLKDIEIIIVNDCSPDPLDDEICKEYAIRDERIIYIQHEKNLGQGGARNTGIKVAQAQYVGGVDSDDWIAPNMFELLYHNAIQTEADIVVGGYTAVFTHNRVDRIFKNEIKEVVPEEIFDIMNPMFCTKLWKKELFINNQVFFPNHLYYEDWAIVSTLTLLSKRISFISDVPYFYRKRSGSTSFQTSNKVVDDSIQVSKLIKQSLMRLGYFELLKKQYYIEMSKHFNHIICCVLESAKGMNGLEKDDLGEEDESIFFYEQNGDGDSPRVRSFMLYLLTQLFQIEDIEDFMRYNNITNQNLYYIFINRGYREKYEILEEQYDTIKTNRWYLFGNLSKYGKCKKLIKFMIRKLLHYTRLKREKNI